MRYGRRCFKETGQAVVEFGLILPIFLLILFFIVDFGWVAYQRASFEYGYMRAGWAVSADDLNDADLLEEIPSENQYTGSIVADAIRDYLEDSNLGISPANLNISNARALLYNKKELFNVPGRNPGEKVEATNITRHMDISASIQYDVYPITYVGKIFFGNIISLKKDLNRTRIVRTQVRTE